MDQISWLSPTWKLMPRFTSFSSLIPLFLVVQMGFAKMVDNPPDGQFLRRSLSRVVVLGNYLYIDGGEVAQISQPSSPFSFPNNSTLSIDISQSWNAKTVEIKATPKPQDKGPVPTADEALWTDPSGEAFYVFGGRTSRGVGQKRLAKNGIWKFTVDGAGGGTWALEKPSNMDMLKNITLTNRAAYATSHTSSGSVGYSIGGWAYSYTDPDWKGEANGEPYAAMVSYNMNTKTLSKSSFKAAVPPTGTLRDARAEFVPQFGPNGLVFVIGGLAFKKDLTKDHMIDMTNITFFNPGTGQWLWQKTTGDAPSSRQSFCMVGAPGPAGTYELFIYGGNDINDKSSFDDFYVLSLPGFRWFQVTDRTPERRAETSCAVIGNRQMLIVGGHDFSRGSTESWKIQDTFPQGLGIFDMVNLTFVKNFSYNAHAEAYRTPKVIEEWYRNNADLSVAVPEWSSDVVKSIFLAKPVTFNDSNSNSTNPGDPNLPPPETPSNNSKVGVIVGGVVGAIAGMAILGFLIYYFWIRKRKSRALTPSSQHLHVEMGSVKGTGGVTSSSFKTKEPTELSTEPLVAEMPVSPTDYSNRAGGTNGGIYELDGTNRHGELHRPHRS